MHPLKLCLHCATYYMYVLTLFDVLHVEDLRAAHVHHIITTIYFYCNNCSHYMYVTFTGSPPKLARAVTYYELSHTAISNTQ